MEPEYYPLTINENNILAASLWAMGVCSCVSLVCQHKKKLPITVTSVKKWGDETEYLIEKKEDGNLEELKHHLIEKVSQDRDILHFAKSMIIQVYFLLCSC